MPKFEWFIFDFGYGFNRYTDDAIEKLGIMRKKPGCYVFHTSAKCLYVGTASNLPKRVSQSARRLLKKVNSKVFLSVYECSTSSDAAIFEIFLINKLKPRLNSVSKLNDGVTLKLENEPIKSFSIEFLKNVKNSNN